MANIVFNRTNELKQLEPGLNAIFGDTYNGYEMEHAELFQSETSDRAYEEDVLMTGFAGAPDKEEGEAVTYDSATEGWLARYNHVTVALAFAMTEEAMEDNLYERMSVRLTRSLATAMAHTKQVKGANIFNQGFNTDGLHNGGDGVPLFSASHPLINGNTFSNTAAVDLSEDALEDAFIAIEGWTNDRGIPMAFQARKLAIPRNLVFVANRLINPRAVERPGTAERDINAIVALGMLPEGYCVNHRFTDPDAWFLLTDCPDGLKHFTRVGVQTGFEGDFETGNVRYKSRERYSFGWSNPRGAYGSSGN